MLQLSGEIFPAEGSISKLEIDEERVYTSVLRDITIAMHAEQALQQTNEHLRALIRASPIAIITLDLQKRVEIWNEAAEPEWTMPGGGINALTRNALISGSWRLKNRTACRPADGNRGPRARS